MSFQDFDSKTVLNETSLGMPALALLTDNTNLVLAWTERDSPNQISLAVCNDVLTLPLQFGRKQTLSFRSAAGPAVAAGPNYQTYLAWRGADNDATLYFSSTKYDPNNRVFNFGPGVSLYEWSFYAPALTADPVGPSVILSWTGTDEFALVNVKQSFDFGMSFQQWTKRTLREDSIASPGIVLIPSLGILKPLLYLFWTGTDANSSLNIRRSLDGLTWDDKTKQILPEVSPFGPGAGGSVIAGDSVFFSWTGYDSERHVNSYRHFPGGANLYDSQGTKIIFNDTSPAAVSICGVQDGAYAMAWIDFDGKINVGVKMYY